MTRPKRSVARSQKTLMELPEDVLGQICTICDVSTKMRLGATCTRLREVLANPGNDSNMWGAISVSVGTRAIPVSELVHMVTWLAQRAAGIQRLVLHGARPVPGNLTLNNKTLHKALFCLAGAFQGTHVALELRAREDSRTRLTVPPRPFLEHFWAPPVSDALTGYAALTATLTALEVQYELPGYDSLRYLCLLPRLEEATLCLTVQSGPYQPDTVWVASDGLPALRELNLFGDPWCAEAILNETGPRLTRLHFSVEGAGTTSLTRLTALRRLTLRSCDCDTMAGADFSQMTGLTGLHLSFENELEDTSLEATINANYAFLVTFRKLRHLTLESLNGVNDALVAAVAGLSKLERLHFLKLQDWEWSAANIRLLIARSVAERPVLSIKVDEPLDTEEWEQQ